jgi:hypothetical protein
MKSGLSVTLTAVGLKRVMMQPTATRMPCLQARYSGRGSRHSGPWLICISTDRLWNSRRRMCICRLETSKKWWGACTSRGLWRLRGSCTSLRRGSFSQLGLQQFLIGISLVTFPPLSLDSAQHYDGLLTLSLCCVVLVLVVTANLSCDPKTPYLGRFFVLLHAHPDHRARSGSTEVALN